MSNDSSRNVVIGIDLGDRTSSFCVLAEGEVEERGEVRTTPAALRRWLAGRETNLVVMEAGTHSPWVGRLVEEMGMEAVVLNPLKLHYITKSETKNDRNDAERLAYLGSLGAERLGIVHHRRLETQSDLAVIRGRAALVRARTLLVNQVRSTVKSLGGRLPACDADAFHRRAALEMPENARVATAGLLEAIKTLTEQIHEADRAIEWLGRERYPETQRLRQINGVGPLTSLTYVLTVEDPGRFRRGDAVGAYLGLVPKQRQSGGRDPQLGITKAGDGYLRSLLVEAAHYVCGVNGKDCDLKRWAVARMENGGKSNKKRIIIAVARKLAVLLHRLWTTGEAYRPHRDVVATSAA